jgi:hypothetical protein
LIIICLGWKYFVFLVHGMHMKRCEFNRGLCPSEVLLQNKSLWSIYTHVYLVHGKYVLQLMMNGGTRLVLLDLQNTSNQKICSSHKLLRPHILQLLCKMWLFHPRVLLVCHENLIVVFCSIMLDVHYSFRGCIYQ